MDIYIILFIFLFLGVFIAPKKQELYYWISFVFMFILSAFRDVSVGTDTIAYEMLFRRVEDGGLIGRLERGWYYMNKWIVDFGGGFEWVLIISTILILIPLFWVIKKHSLNPMLSVFLFLAFYIYLQSFNISRQVVSVSIVFASFHFLIKEKYKYYIMGVFLASLFHTTAMVCIPLIFANRIRYNKIWWSILIILSLIFGFLLSSIGLPVVAKILGYSHYLIPGDDDMGAGIFSILTNVFALFVIFTSVRNNIYIQLFFIYIVFSNLITGVPYAYRLVFFLSITQLLFLPYYIYNNKLKLKKMALLIVLIYATLYFTRSYGAAGIFPYENTLF